MNRVCVSCGRHLLIAISLLTGCSSSEETEVAEDKKSNRSVSRGSSQTSKTPPSDTSQSIARASELANKKEYDQAIQVMQQALLQNPNDQQSLLLTAQLLAAKGNHAQALKVIESVDANSTQLKLTVLGHSAEWLLTMGRLNDAADRLSALLQIAPDHPMANRFMFRICNAQGRRFDSVPYTKHVIASGDFQLSDLAMLCNIENTFRDPELRALMDKSASQKEHILVYDARDKLVESKLEQADQLITQAVAVNSQNLEAWVWFGHVKAQREQWEALPKWLDRRPPRFDTHPEFWNVMGTWLLHQRRPSEAIAALHNALKLDPRGLTATQLISTALIDLDRLELAKTFRHRSCYIVKSNNHVRNALASLELHEIKSAASDYNKLGDSFLADAWQKTGNYFEQKGTPSSSPRRHFNHHSKHVHEYAPEDLSLDALLTSLTSLDLPKISIEELAASSTKSPEKNSNFQGMDQWKLTDVAINKGLGNAQYDWGLPPEESWIYIFRTLGGGTAVLDYDLNGFPDLFFSRAGAKSLSDPSLNKPKQFFRNFEGIFHEVDSNLINLIDRGFGQGVACGDYDQDGMTDLLVANIGSCILYGNQGDGTFLQVHALDLNPETRWATACTLADINRDGFPDIFVGTYLGESDYETRKCSRHDTTALGCPPQVFPGSQDIMLINTADGHWRDEANAISGIIDPGRSLGVVVGDFDKQVGNDIYVANDETPNHFYINQLDENNQIQLMQSASLAGVAVATNGRSQGSMGIAVCDLDKNGLDDIFVTNAMGEYNALYLQKRPNIYVDGTRKWNLYESSLKMVGFGCVFADMDDNGWEDLFIVNGNVNDHRDINEGYKFLAQVYRNDGSQMTPIEPKSLSGYFEEPTLGRGLATLDFDLDHKLDFVVTHCDRNAALLQNQTETRNHFIEFELTGVQCDRDAIGARVELQCGDLQFSDALYSGESYYSSCEKLIHIGTGNASLIDNMTVYWPDGSIQKISDPFQTDQRLLLVQGHSPVPR